ncbi:Glutamate synthase [NADPH] large chain [hydrothermal vent metagenome]|uniref:Glutamate synthase [NADPH] large chain n=1 Tax=hydrothermal vent metagenome TaxID=652676 RepID=A0A3B1A0U4_9ZZZZ
MNLTVSILSGEDQGQEYHFCTCGSSKSQPFCDGSHVGTSFTPRVIVSETDNEEAYLCACKHTGNTPYCDGTHKQFSKDDIGKEGPGPTQKPSDLPTATSTLEEPTVEYIHQLAREGLSKLGHHGQMTSMGVPRHELPHWDELQIMAAQMATKPLMEDESVSTELIIGPEAKKPLKLKVPLFVSDMSFGALSEEAKISLAMGIPEGQPAISPPTFKNLSSASEFKDFADHVREITGGIPIGFKLSANHIEKDIQFALDASADYIILDGRGGGTGAAPEMFRNHISVPTIPALARARRYLDKQGASGRVTLIITGGLRVPIDFVKALALGADGIAISNSAMQAIGCVAARMCNTNNCPAGIATQKEELRKKLNIEKSSKQLYNFFNASVELMQVMARACGHDDLRKLNKNDLATWHREMTHLSGVAYSGIMDISGNV